MPTFKYFAKDPNGRDVSGQITAEGESAVVAELRKRSLTILSISEGKSRAARQFSFSGKRVKGDDLVVFARQLATMVEAGIPIVQAMDALSEQMVQPYFRTVLTAVRDDIEKGSSLSAGFSKHGTVFDSLFINMVKVGETGGVLADVLDRVASYMEKTLKLRRKVQAAMVYPAVVVSLALIITIFLLWKVVPTFASIYDSLDAELPALTQTLINVSNFVKSGIGFIIGGVIVLVFLFQRWYRTEKGRVIIDRAVLKIPIFGELARKVAISRFSRTLSTLLQSGVPILESLEIVGKTCGNRIVEMVVQNVKESVREGESIATPLTKSGVFPPMVTRMIAVGEKSGQMEKMLNKISEFYDEQIDAVVSSLTSIIEPLIIAFLGLVVGFIVISLFLPILNITRIL